MSLFILINNSSTVKDGTPVKIFQNKEVAIQNLYEYEMKSVFKPILLYEYLFVDGQAQFPKWFYKVKRDSKGIVEGIEQTPVNITEYIKTHPFVFDKLESMFDASTRKERAV